MIVCGSITQFKIGVEKTIFWKLLTKEEFY